MKVLLAFVGAVILLSSCGRDESFVSEPMANNSAPCQMSSFAQPMDIGKIVYFKPVGISPRMSYSSRVPSKCDSAPFVLRVAGNFHQKYQMHDEEPVAGIVVRRAFLEIRDPSLLKSARQDALCGVRSWRAGEKIEVTGMGCQNLDINEGDLIYNITKVDDRSGLYLGRLRSNKLE